MSNGIVRLRQGKVAARPGQQAYAYVQQFYRLTAVVT